MSNYYTVEDYEDVFTNPFSPFLFRNIEEMDAYFTIKGNGEIATKKELQKLIKKLNNFIDKFPEEEIYKHNNKIREDAKIEENKNEDILKQGSIQKAPISGYIYFVTTNHVEYKIGCTKNIKNRLGEYTHLPYEPILVHLIESKDCFVTEELFHEKYKKKRLRGEWFSLDKDDIEYITKGKYTKSIIHSIKGGKV